MISEKMLWAKVTWNSYHYYRESDGKIFGGIMELFSDTYNASYNNQSLGSYISSDFAKKAVEAKHQWTEHD